MSRKTKAQNAKDNRAYRQRRKEQEEADRLRLIYVEARLEEAFLDIAKRDLEIDRLRRARTLLMDMVAKATKTPAQLLNAMIEDIEQNRRLLQQVSIEDMTPAELEAIYPSTKRLTQ
jgi:NCAIR mutase (PurE)-related protein